jgi:hypothetical protein
VKSAYVKLLAQIFRNFEPNKAYLQVGHGPPGTVCFWCNWVLEEERREQPLGSAELTTGEYTLCLIRIKVVGRLFLDKRKMGS